MVLSRSRLAHTLAAATLTLASSFPAFADDTEIFRSQEQSLGARPNVLFILDTSLSMDSLLQVTPPPYDPAKDYGTSCVAAGRLYWSTNGAPPACNSNSWINASTNTCAASASALGSGGIGFWGPAKVAHLRRTASSSTVQWRTLAGSDSTYQFRDRSIECAADHGSHGQNNATNPYLRQQATAGWQATAPAQNPWNNLNTQYTLYSSNYVNYWHTIPPSDPIKRIDVVKQVAGNLIDTLSGVNLGLMRFNPAGTNGGTVVNAVKNIDSGTHRQDLKTSISGIRTSDLAAHTPISETLYEAARYLAGRSMDTGNTTRTDAAARTTPTGNQYKSPIEYKCQKNYIVFLTDGLPSLDNNLESQTAGLVGKTACDAPRAPGQPGFEDTSSFCADDTTEWLAGQDLSSLPEKQSVTSYWIGFGDDEDLRDTGTPFLNELAGLGGTGLSKTAADVHTLTTQLQKIFGDINDTSATFVTPSISVNAFNRTQTQEDLFISVFSAVEGARWPGNLKKYKLFVDSSSTPPGQVSIRDANNRPAIAADGTFASTTQSIWSPETDANKVESGGAANRLPDPANRLIYTNVSSNAELSNAANWLVSTNTNITDELLDIASTGVASATVIDWARGYDVDDRDGDDDRTDAAPKFMGDPLHARPAIVTYGGSSANPNANDLVVFTPTNDGFLHAIDGRSDSATAGQELWAFIPKDLLHRLPSLYENNGGATRTYGLDGDVQVLKFDTDQDGIVEPADGDFVWLYFGMRMGEDKDGKSYYYALDVTARDAPRLLWVLGPDELPGLGQTWSPMTITRVMVGTDGSDNDNDEKLVLIFGGGYDMAAEEYTNTTQSAGNRIFMVDAETGKLLWFAGNTGSDADLERPKMTNSIPGRITVIDLDGDAFADRMYAADLGGRIWRFDIYGGKTASSTTDPLVTGGVIAQLGYGNVTGATAADNRRFYTAPDVAFIQNRLEDPYYAISIGSGYRGHPLDTSVTDWFFSVRDKAPRARWSQTTYDGFTPIVIGNLTDITSNPLAANVPVAQPGWRLRMTLSGEKVLAESTTVNNVVLFTSFKPSTDGAADPCYPSTINRAYAVNVISGKPALDLDGDGTLENSDISTLLQQTGIVGEVNVAFVTPTNPDPNAPPTAPRTVCLAGVNILGKCVDAGATVRTYWERSGAE